MKQTFGKLSFFIVLILVLVLPILAFFKRQDIYDWIRLQGYEPPKEVIELAENTTMTAYATKLFYVNRPELVSNKAEFSNACDQTEHSIVLGCYISGKGIYLYKVSDKRLSGVVEVTAAHEVLHAAYDRLVPKEREQVDNWIDAAYKRLSNKRIKESVARYRKRDPSIVPNELHSIMGTEVRNLSPELENYYRRYFKNRLKVVEYSENYESEFGERQRQVEAYDEQLVTLKTEIDTKQTNLSEQAVALEDERQRIVAMSDRNSTAYAVAVSRYNKKVADYNAQVRKVQQLIDTYNALVKKRNALAVEVQGLIDAIDSRPETIQ